MIFPIVQVAAGVLVLFAGYRLYWVFVGVVGFLVGTTFAEQMWPGLSQAALFGVACLTGLIGIVIFLMTQKLAIALAGFTVGTYALATVFMAFGLDSTVWAWIAMAVGGIGGGLLAFLVFDLALMVLSSLGGAFMITHALVWDPRLKLVAVASLCALGLVSQTKQYRKAKAGD